MKTANVRQIRLHFPEVLRWIEQGEEVVITMRNRIVARLVPERPVKKGRILREDFAAIRKELWGKKVFQSNAVEKEREGYRW